MDCNEQTSRFKTDLHNKSVFIVHWFSFYIIENYWCNVTFTLYRPDTSLRWCPPLARVHCKCYKFLRVTLNVLMEDLDEASLLFCCTINLDVRSSLSGGGLT